MPRNFTISITAICLSLAIVAMAAVSTACRDKDGDYGPEIYVTPTSAAPITCDASAFYMLEPKEDPTPGTCGYTIAASLKEGCVVESITLYGKGDMPNSAAIWIVTPFADSDGLPVDYPSQSPLETSDPEDMKWSTNIPISSDPIPELIEGNFEVLITLGSDQNCADMKDLVVHVVVGTPEDED